MDELWRWLGGDSSPWDAIGTIGVVLVALGLAIAAIRRALAVIAQSKAPRLHDETTDRETETRAPFAERETFPNIIIGTATTRQGEIKEGTIGILNMGGGTAKDLRLFCRDEPSPYEIPLEKQVLVIRDILPVPFVDNSKNVSRFQLTFRTGLGTHYSFEFEWDSSVPQAINERLTVIPPGSIPS
jgi:hypothetical protein